MAKKFYVVWVGRQTGIFTDWDQTKKQVDKYPQAKYKSFKTREEAQAAFAKAPSQSIASKATGTKSGTAKKAVKSPDADHQQFDMIIYTDGGCEPNPGEAGSGVAVYEKGQLSQLWYGLYHPQGTNNSAELNALYQAMLIAQQALSEGKSVKILSDSQYSINCITNWAYSWKAKGWKRKVAGDIKNLDVIQSAHTLYEKLKSELQIEHVSAHVGIEGNELADRMSIYAIDKKDPHFCAYPEPIEVSKILALRTG